MLWFVDLKNYITLDTISLKTLKDRHIPKGLEVILDWFLKCKTETTVRKYSTRKIWSRQWQGLQTKIWLGNARGQSLAVAGFSSRKRRASQLLMMMIMLFILHISLRFLAKLPFLESAAHFSSNTFLDTPHTTQSLKTKWIDFHATTPLVIVSRNTGTFDFLFDVMYIRRK